MVHVTAAARGYSASDCCAVPPGPAAAGGGCSGCMYHDPSPLRRFIVCRTGQTQPGRRRRVSPARRLEQHPEFVPFRVRIQTRAVGEHLHHTTIFGRGGPTTLALWPGVWSGQAPAVGHGTVDNDRRASGWRASAARKT